MKIKTYKIDGLDCADCALHLEKKLNELESIKSAKINFIKGNLKVEFEGKEEEVLSKMQDIAMHEEDEATISPWDIEDLLVNTPGVEDQESLAYLSKKILELPYIHSSKENYLKQTILVSLEKDKLSLAKQEIEEFIHQEEPNVQVSFGLEFSKKKNKFDGMMIRLILGVTLFIASFVVNPSLTMYVCMAGYFLLGYDIIIKAIRNMGKGQLFDENFLMMIATFAAIFIKEYREAFAVILFYQVGEYFQDKAVDYSRDSIKELMHIRPDIAAVQRGKEYKLIPPEDVKIGDLVRILPGERIPVDGVIYEGKSSLNLSSLTGESNWKDVDQEDEVLSGSINGNGTLFITCTKEFKDSMVSKILELVENSDQTRAKEEKFITVFSRFYTPIVVVLAITVAIFVLVVMGDYSQAIERACTFLVISCPCALVISIPLSFFSGIGGLSKQGILVKGANVFEKINKIRRMVFDKTGTLSKGKFEVEELISETPEEMLKLAAALETQSKHPLASAILEKNYVDLSELVIKEVKEIPGRGLSGLIQGEAVLVGNAKQMEEAGISVPLVEAVGTKVYVAKNNSYVGCIVLRDQKKAHADRFIQYLHNQKILTKIVSGDGEETVKKMASELNIPRYLANQLPDGKVDVIQREKEEGFTCFVGDGTNDAPVMVNADVSIAMGMLGSDAAIEAADVVLMDDSLIKIQTLMEHSKKVVKLAIENIIFAIGIKILFLVLGALGYANMWMAIFADTGVAILCVLNSLRVLKVDPNQLEESKD